MPRPELLAKLRLWIGRMSEAQLAALADDLKENMPEVADLRYDGLVAMVRDLLAGQEDAEGLVRVLREKGCLKVFLGR
jgi:hypothetical protein